MQPDSMEPRIVNYALKRRCDTCFDVANSPIYTSVAEITSVLGYQASNNDLGHTERV